MERNSATSVRDDPHSLAPVQIESSSIDEELAELKRGKGARLVLTMLFAGMAAFGVLQWMRNIDGAQQYANAAERVDEINSQQAIAYLHCVLPDVQRSQLASRQALHTAFESMTERYQKYYAAQIQRCAPMLDELVHKLNGVNVPADVRPQLQGLRNAAADLQRTLGAYQGYLADPSRPYDYVQATPMIERVTLAWSAYEDQRAQTNQSLRKGWAD
jgi:hypothetical protein